MCALNRLTASPAFVLQLEDQDQLLGAKQKDAAEEEQKEGEEQHQGPQDQQQQQQGAPPCSGRMGAGVFDLLPDWTALISLFSIAPLILCPSVPPPQQASRWTTTSRAPWTMCHRTSSSRVRLSTALRCQFPASTQLLSQIYKSLPLTRCCPHCCCLQEQEGPDDRSVQVGDKSQLDYAAGGEEEEDQEQPKDGGKDQQQQQQQKEQEQPQGGEDKQQQPGAEEEEENEEEQLGDYQDR